MWIEHVLVGFIMIVVPLVSIRGLRKLKQNQDPYGKIKTYLKTIAGLLIITGLIWSISLPKLLFYFNYTIHISTPIKVVLVLCFIFFIVTTIMPLLLLKNKEFKAKL